MIMSPDKLIDPLVLRALSAYWSTTTANPRLDPHPSVKTSNVTEHEGLQYVVLRNVDNADEVLAVYRVLNSGQLKRLHCWPKI